MKFEGLAIAGAARVLLEPKTDDRGSFSRVFCAREFAAAGLQLNVVQSNLARSRHAGIVRGLHYQLAPAGEAKLVRCLRGAVFDVIVDMRRDSPSYRQVHAERLDAVDGVALYIPAGVAHGYQTLEDEAEFFYMTDQYYQPQLETGLRFDDPALKINWPLPPREVTSRDGNWPLLGDAQV